MMILRDKDGVEFRGETATDLVAALHADSQTPCETDAAFMEETAKRIYMTTGVTVRYTKAEDFINDLIGTGFLDAMQLN